MIRPMPGIPGRSTRIRTYPNRIARLSMLLGLALISIPGTAAATWFADVEAALTNDDNISRGELDSDIHGDSSVEFSADIGKFHEFSEGKSITFIGSVKAASFNKFEGLSNHEVGITLTGRNKFGLGAYTPWVSVSASAAVLRFSEDVRDGSRYTFDVMLGKRFSERFDLVAGFGFDRRNALNDEPAIPALTGGNVFSLKGYSLYVDGNYAYSDRAVVSFGYAYRNGQIASTAIPTARIINASSAIIRDRVFGPGKFAYRLSAYTHTLRFNLSHSIGLDSSFNLALERQMTTGNDDIDYDNMIVRASLLFGF